VKGKKNICQYNNNSNTIKHTPQPLEFKAVMVLPEITVITVMVITLEMHLVGKVSLPYRQLKNWECSAHGIINTGTVKMTGNHQLCAYCSPNSRRRKL